MADLEDAAGSVSPADPLEIAPVRPAPPMRVYGPPGPADMVDAAVYRGLDTMAGSVMAGLAHSAAVRSAAADVAQAGAEIRIARSGYYPTLTSSAGTGGLDSYDAEVALAQPIYDWGRTGTRIKQARAVRAGAEAAFAAARETAAYEAAGAFIQLKRMRELEAAAADNVLAHERIAELARIRTEGGVGDATEKGLAGVRLGESRSALEDARGNVRIARNLYVSKVGAAAPGELAAVPDLRLALAAEGALEAAVEVAPAVRIALARERQAEAQARLERAGLFPRLEAAAYVRSFDNLGRTDAGVGLRLTGPVITGLANFERIEAAKLQAESARWQAETARRDVMLRLRDLIERAPTLEEQVTILEVQLRDALVLRDLYEIQFKLGRRSLVDFLNVQADIFRIARALVNTGYDIFALQYAAAEGLGRLETLLGLAEPGA